MTAPKRVQLRRAKGWRKPEGVIVVARPTTWGNPFTIAGAREAGYEGTDEELRGLCVALYRDWLRDPQRTWSHGADQAGWIADNARLELGGHDLACWCPLDQPCHADVLLELANPGQVTTTIAAALAAHRERRTEVFADGDTNRTEHFERRTTPTKDTDQ